MTIFKRYGIKINLHEKKDFFDYLRLDAPKNFFNLGNLVKMFEVFAKLVLKQ